MKRIKESYTFHGKEIKRFDDLNEKELEELNKGYGPYFWWCRSDEVEKKYYLAHRYDRWIRSGCAICWSCPMSDGHPIRMEADERKAHEWCRVWMPQRLRFQME
jgi:hypothetical protein